MLQSAFEKRTQSSFVSMCIDLHHVWQGLNKFYYYLQSINTFYYYLQSINTFYYYLQSINTFYYYLQSINTFYYYLQSINTFYYYLQSINTFYYYLQLVITIRWFPACPCIALIWPTQLSCISSSWSAGTRPTQLSCISSSWSVGTKVGTNYIWTLWKKVAGVGFEPMTGWLLMRQMPYPLSYW